MKLRKFLADQWFRVTGMTRRNIVEIYDTLPKEHRAHLKRKGVVFGPRSHPVRGTTRRTLILPERWSVVVCGGEKRFIKDEWGYRLLSVSDSLQESELLRF